MTEISKSLADLPDPIRRFVLHWGNMGDSWGVNRSVSQVHALLYAAERPLTAEEIAEALSMARSNVSTSLRELASWQLIRRIPVLGDRRDHFQAETDLWTMVKCIAAGRKARELDDTGNGASGRTYFLDASGNVVHAEGSAAVLYGVDGLLVVTLPGLTFVTTVEKAADLKPLLDALPSDLRQPGRNSSR